MALFRIIGFAFALLSIALPVHAQTTAEKYGTMPETWDAQISPDGKHLALGCSPTGVRAICLYQLDSDARPRLIAPPEDGKIEGLRWASPGYLIYFVSVYETIGTSSGLRDYTFRRMASYDVKSGNSEILMRREKFRVDTAIIYSMLVDDDEHILTVINRPNIVTQDKTMKVNLRTGKSRRVLNVKDTGWIIFDEQGDEVAGVEWWRSVLKIKSYVDGDRTVYEWENFDEEDMARIDLVGIDASKSRMYIDFTMADRYGLHQVDLETGDLSPVLFNGRSVGKTSVVRDSFTNGVIGFTFANDLPQVKYIDSDFADVADKAQSILKSDSVRLISWTRDKTLFTLVSRKDGEPSTYYLYDRAAPSISPIGGEAPWLADAPLGTVKAFTYEARDGMALKGYYTLPAGATTQDGPFPTVLMPHGGPQARDYATYDWMAQALAAEGYLVIQPNFRGSSGYGFDYLSAG